MNNQIPLKYSQNFITSSRLITELIELSNIKHTDLVLDIGSGEGIISKELSKHAKYVVGIEKDPNLFKKSTVTLDGINNVEIINGDFLKFNLPKEDYKVFANIPFSITAEITRKLLDSYNPPVAAYLFMQLEAATRYVGSPSYNESLLSLLYKPNFSIKIIHNFRRMDFNPAPSKDVCLVEFILKEIPDFNAKEYLLYKDFVTYALNRWKPNIKLALKGVFSNLQLKILSTNLKFSLESKPTELNYKTWVLLFKEFIKITPRYKQNLVKGSTDKLILNQKKMRDTNKLNLLNRINDKSTDSKPYLGKRGF